MWLSVTWVALVVLLFAVLPVAHRHLDRQPRGHQRNMRRAHRWLRAETRARHRADRTYRAAPDKAVRR